MLDLFKDAGGYILAPAHAIQRDVPLENVLALIDAGRDNCLRDCALSRRELDLKWES